MSVLIGSLTLVVQKLSIYLSFPGDEIAFLQQIRQLEREPRFVCTNDAACFNISFRDAEHARPCLDILERSGLVGVNKVTGEYEDFALLREETGPLVPAPWLLWKRHSRGFTLAWDVDEEIGDLAAPEDWTPGRSVGAVGAPNVAVSLAQAPALRAPGINARRLNDSAPSLSSGTVSEGPLFLALETALRELKWVPSQIGEPVAVVERPGFFKPYRCRYSVWETEHIVSCITDAPRYVPEEALSLAMNFITRVNAHLRVGGFDLILERRRLQFRAALQCRDILPTQSMIRYLAEISATMLDVCYPRLFEACEQGRPMLDALNETREDLVAIGEWH